MDIALHLIVSKKRRRKNSLILRERGREKRVVSFRRTIPLPAGIICAKMRKPRVYRKRRGRKMQRK